MASRKKAAPPERATRRQYTSEQREAVLADVRVIGVCATAAKHGVAQSCVSRWAKTARVSRSAPVEGHPAKATPTPATTPAATPAPPPAPPVTANGDTARAVAKTAAKSGVARLYTPSQKAEVLEYASTHSITEASNKFGISRFSIYDWRRKVTKAAAGKGSSPTSGAAPKDIEATRDREILAEWHKHPGLGPSQIVNQLRRAGIKVAVHTTRRVMEDAGYRPPKVKREPHDERYEAVRPNHLWHVDFVQRFINRVRRSR